MKETNSAQLSALNVVYFYRDVAGHERFGHMTRVYYKYA